MKLLYKLFKQDPDSRDGVITVTSALGIIVNLLIAAAKMIIGALASSMAILSEGANNASDAATSVLALVGAKLSAKRPTRKHPFGFGRIEYLTSLVISGLILFTGGEVLVESVKAIFEPAELTVSYLSLGIVAGSAVIKFLLGRYTVAMGKKSDSGSLIAVGKDCQNDSFVSVITIVSALVFLIFKLNVDAYAGVITSVLILKAGIEVLSSTIGDLLGRSGNEELAQQLYKEIRSCGIVLNAADMMLHNYGPDNYSGSVNIEIDHAMTIEEAYTEIHKLQLRLMHEYHVTMVFGMYAVGYDHEQGIRMRKEIAAFVRDYEHVTSYHALFVREDEKKIYCDLVVDYDLRDWDTLRGKFTDFMREKYPDYDLELTIETEFV